MLFLMRCAELFKLFQGSCLLTFASPSCCCQQSTGKVHGEWGDFNKRGESVRVIYPFVRGNMFGTLGEKEKRLYDGGNQDAFSGFFIRIHY